MLSRPYSSLSLKLSVTLKGHGKVPQSTDSLHELTHRLLHYAVTLCAASSHIRRKYQKHDYLSPVMKLRKAEPKHTKPLRDAHKEYSTWPHSGLVSSQIPDLKISRQR